ncbi:MAG: flavin reductase family protein [Candidatus Obscuribacterales bacterium]|nr:flavin reductase family protein [Candidatus Obscuribacterales bacterium]
MTSTTENPTSKEILGPALGKLSSGVYIVTHTHDNDKEGMLATWIIQAAFEPPMLTVSIQKERHFLSKLQKGVRFTVNAISKKNMDIFKAFARPHKEGEDRFAELKLADKKAAGAVFADALSYLDCVVKDQMEAGDHVVVLAEVVGGGLLNEDEAMLHTRKNGFQY